MRPLRSARSKAGAIAQNTPVLRSGLQVILLGVLHTVLTVGLLVYSFSASMKQFDDPAYRPPTTATVAGGVTDVLMLPVAPFWSRWASTRLPNEIELALFGLNSVLWGFAIAVLGWTVRSRRSERNQPSRLVTLLGASVLMGIGLLGALEAVGIDGQPDDVIVEFDGSHQSLATVVTLLLSIGVAVGGVFLFVRGLGVNSDVTRRN